MAWAEAYFPTKWRPHPYSRLATLDMGENWGSAPFRGNWDPSNTINVTWAEVHLRANWHVDPSSRLATIDIWAENWVGAVPFFSGELGPHLTQSGLGRSLSPYQAAS